MNKSTLKLIVVSAILVILIIVGTICAYIDSSHKNIIDSSNTTVITDDSATKKTSTENENKKDQSEGEDKKPDNEKNSAIPTHNLIEDMSQDEIRELNIFFSNFSEAFFYDYNPDDTSEEALESLVSFGFTHNMINSGNYPVSENDRTRMGFPAASVKEAVKKYIGVDIQLRSYDYYTYDNEYFWVPQSSGESYDYFAVVTDMRDNGDGTFVAKYNTYWAGDGELTNDHYSYTDKKAAASYQYISQSTAQIRPKVYKGNNTYELIALESEENTNMENLNE